MSMPRRRVPAGVTTWFPASAQRDGQRGVGRLAVEQVQLRLELLDLALNRVELVLHRRIPPMELVLVMIFKVLSSTPCNR